MSTENIVLMQNARASLQGRWGLAIGTCVIYLLIVGTVAGIPFLGGIASLFIAGQFAVGMATFSLSIARNQA